MAQSNTLIVEVSRNLLCFPHLHSSIIIHYIGDIESLKGCPLKVLNLAGEKFYGQKAKFTGVYPCKSTGIVVRLQASRASPLLGTFPGTLFISPHPSFFHLSTPLYVPGDIEVFKGMALTSLNLHHCSKLTGVFGVGY